MEPPNEDTWGHNIHVWQTRVKNKRHYYDVWHKSFSVFQQSLLYRAKKITLEHFCYCHLLNKIKKVMPLVLKVKNPKSYIDLIPTGIHCMILLFL